MPSKKLTSVSPASAAAISQSLSSHWTRYSGVKPSKVSTEIRETDVRCVLADARGGKKGNSSGSHLEGDESSGLARFRRDAVAAVGNLTGRRVSSLSSSHDAETDTAVESFIFER